MKTGRRQLRFGVVAQYREGLVVPAGDAQQALRFVSEGRHAIPCLHSGLGIERGPVPSSAERTRTPDKAAGRRRHQGPADPGHPAGACIHQPCWVFPAR